MGGGFNEERATFSLPHTDNEEGENFSLHHADKKFYSVFWVSITSCEIIILLVEREGQ